MAVTTCMPDKFREDLFFALHDFTLTTGHVFKLGLFKAAASVVGTYDKNTENYASIGTDENADTDYVAAKTLTNVSPTHDSTNHVAYVDFSNDVTWAASTITASAAFIYNDTHANDRIVSLHDFGGDKSSSGGDYIIQMPAPAYNTAILRLA